MAVCPQCHRKVPFTKFLSVPFEKPFFEMRFRCQCGAWLSSPRDVKGYLVTFVLGFFISYLLARHYKLEEFSSFWYLVAIILWFSMYAVLVWPRVRLRVKR